MSNFPFLSNDRIFDIRVFVGTTTNYLKYSNELIRTFKGRDSELYRKYSQSDRDTYALHGSEIINYSINSSLSDRGICIGDVVSSSFSMTVDNSSTRSGAIEIYERLTTGIVLTAFLYLLEENDNGGYTVLERKPFGMWAIETVDKDEYSSTTTYTGHDVIYNFNTKDKLVDRITYTSETTWGDVFAKLAVASFRSISINDDEKFCVGTDPFNGRSSVVDVDTTNKYYATPWWTRPSDGLKYTDLREATFTEWYRAICYVCGGFVFADYYGRVQLHSFGNQNRYPKVITEPYIHSLATEGGSFTFDGIYYDKIKSEISGRNNENGIEEIYDLKTTPSYYYIDSYGQRKKDKIDLNTIMPIRSVFANNVQGTTVIDELTSIGTISSGTITFVGDPTIQVGDIIYISKTGEIVSPDSSTISDSDSLLKFLCSSINYTFDGGLTCTVRSDMPTDYTNSDVGERLTYLYNINAYSSNITDTSSVDRWA